MKIKKNGKVITLTESDLQRIVKKVINEQQRTRDIDLFELGTFKVYVVDRTQSKPSVTLQNDDYGTIVGSYDCNSGDVTLHTSTNTKSGEMSKGAKTREEVVDFLKKFNSNKVDKRYNSIRDNIKNLTTQYCKNSNKLV